MLTFKVYVSGRGGVYGYTAEEPPDIGQLITLDESDLTVRIMHAQPSHADDTVLYIADPVDAHFANPY